jgi:hypothetical protein
MRFCLTPWVTFLAVTKKGPVGIRSGLQEQRTERGGIPIILSDPDAYLCVAGVISDPTVVKEVTCVYVLKEKKRKIMDTRSKLKRKVECRSKRKVASGSESKTD